MLKLKQLVRQLDEEIFIGLSEQLSEENSNKLDYLLIAYRENKLSEEAIEKKLDVSTTALYTLKSRLFDRIQEYLLANLENPKIEVLRKVANIPSLLYRTPKRTAIAVLLKLADDLQDFDLPHELAVVYDALKKLHLYTPKYYEYSQAYNRHIAYKLALDKAEDLLAELHKHLGEYYLSRDYSILEILPILKKKMDNNSQLYDSHHMTVYKGMMDITFALFLPLPEVVKEDPPVEDILAKCADIISRYPKDANYQYISNVFSFLSFEYYHKIKIYKKEEEGFNTVNEHLSNFLLYNFCAFTSKFLISKIERYLYLGKEELLYEENKTLIETFHPNKDDVHNYINYNKYLAVSAFYAKQYNETNSILNNLLNEVSFRNYPHADLEIKLLLSLSLSMVNKYDLAFQLIRSVSRRVKELSPDRDYENVEIFIKIT